MYIKLRRWLSPLSQHISANSFRFAKIAQSKMSEMVVSLRFTLIVGNFSLSENSSVLYSIRNIDK